MNRLLFLAHRYLGIALGLVVSVWCLSGIVMMYVEYPELTEQDEVGMLDSLDFSDCCRLPADAALDRNETDTFWIEMLAGRPVLRHQQGSSQRYWDLSSGEPLGPIDAQDARQISLHHAANAGIASFGFDGPIERDQWTVYGAYDPHRPLYQFTESDTGRTRWYVSSATGEIVNWTTAEQRFWNWLGAVPHWLYPTLLRQHTQVWAQVVVWLTIFATFLTVFGIYIGIRQYKSRRSGRYSPYRGIPLWHHYCGLFFGAFTLIWLVSGFFSMNPWGALEGRDFSAELARYNKAPSGFDQWIPSVVSSLPDRQLPEQTVRLELESIAGQNLLVAWNKTGNRQLLDDTGVSSSAVPEPFFSDAPGILRPDVSVVEAGWLHSDDAYYYNHHEERELPVYRIIFADGERFYLDAVTADVVHAVDTNARWYRWLHYALHRGDFPVLRDRPIWDVWMLALLGGVTLGALTGTWMGIKRIARRQNSRRESRKGRFRPPAGVGQAVR